MNLDLHIAGALQGEALSGAARIAAGALIAGLWQGLLLCAATGVVLKAVPKGTARLRFVVWSSVFCVSVAMPFVPFVGGVPDGQAGVATQLRWVLDPRWSYAFAAVWVVAAVYRICELFVQGICLRALWRSAVPVANEALAGFDAPLVVGGRTVEVCTSGEVDRPSVIGFLAPKILIPEWLLPELSATELNHIVLHEMEHLRRRDDWMNLLQKAGLALLPLNPALFWIDRRLSTERELACDDGVLERTSAPRAYAASLTSIAERRLEARRRSRLGALALAATGMRRRQSELGQRIESILARRTPVDRAFASGMAGLLVVAVVGSAAWLARAPQLVSFGNRPARQQQAAATTEIGSPMREATLRPLPVAAGETMLSADKALNVSFRAPGRRATGQAQSAGLQSVGLQSVGLKSTGPQAERTSPTAARAVPVSAAQRFAGQTPNGSAVPGQFVVLTSWEDSPVSRVLIAMPDGRVFVAPYAAVPTRAGWLLVQL